MNITPLTIYLWQQSDSIIGVIQGSFFILIPLLICLALFYGNNAENAKHGWRMDKAAYPSLNRDMDVAALEARSLAANVTLRAWIVRASVALALSIISIITIPSSKTIAMMVVIPKIAESKVIQQDLPDIYNAAIKSLKEQLAEKK